MSMAGIGVGLGVLAGIVNNEGFSVVVAGGMLAGWAGVFLNRLGNARRRAAPLVLGPRHLVPVAGMLVGLGYMVESLPEDDRPLWLNAFLAAPILILVAAVSIFGTLFFLRGLRKLFGTLPPGTKWSEFPITRLGSELAGEGLYFDAAPPDAKPRPLAPPAPAKPTVGWWIDPEDASLIRFHDGERWTDEVGRSTAPRPEWPGVQTIRGIKTRRPLRPGKGRYLSISQIWGLIGALVVGVIVARWQIVLGGILIMGSMGTMLVSAIRAGYRPTIPGTGHGPFELDPPEPPDSP
jgi:hypothetical protein